MATIVNTHDAKTNLSRLLERVKAGEEIIIARAGEPVAKLVAIEPPRKERKLGTGIGEVWMADDFDEPMHDLIDIMENGPIFPDEASSR